MMPDHQLDESGFVTPPRWMDTARCDELLAALKEDGTELRRNLLRQFPEIQDIISHELVPLLQPFGLAEFFPVRALFFDKTSSVIGRSQRDCVLQTKVASLASPDRIKLHWDSIQFAKESQRDSVPKPRVARNALPWVSVQ